MLAAGQLTVLPLSNPISKQPDQIHKAMANLSQACLHESHQYPHSNRRKMNELTEYAHAHTKCACTQLRRKGVPTSRGECSQVQRSALDWLVVEFGICALIHNMFVVTVERLLKKCISPF